jgi:fibronectin-binding autotransporter adhesin
MNTNLKPTTHRKPFLTLLIALVTLLGASMASAVTYYSIATGNWNANTTWSTTSGGAAAGAGVFPVAGDTVTIERGCTVTVNAASACASLQLGSAATTTSSGTLTFSGGSTLAVSGAMAIGSNGNAGRTGTITFTSGATLTAGSLALGGPAGTPAPGTITMTLGGMLSVGGALTVNTVTGNTWTPGTGTVVLTATTTLPASIFTSFCNLTINSGAAVTLSQNTTINAPGVCTVNNGGLLTLGSAVVLSGTGAFTLSAGGTLACAHAGGLEGNITTSTKTFDPAANYTYNGGAIQVTGSLLPATVNNLTINNTAGAGTSGVTLSGTVTVNGTLTLTSGKLTTSANQVNVANTSDAAISGGSGSSYVVGALQKSFPSTGNPHAFTYPIGNAAASAYTPVALAALTVGTAGTLTATTTGGGEHPNVATSGLNAGQDVNRYWTLTPDGAFAASGASATFTFLAGDVDGGAPTAAFVVRRYNGGWSATTTGTRTATSAQATGLSAFGDFAIGENVTDHYAVTAATPQTAGVAFNTTVTAQDIFNQTVEGDSTTAVTLTGTGGAQFDSNGDGVFGDNTRTLAGGTFTINTRDNNAETITLAATDATPKTGASASVAVNTGTTGTGAYRSATSGNWAAVGTWERWNGSAWVAASAAPATSDDVVTIRNGHTVTVAASVSSDQVIVEAGGQVTVNSGITWTIANGAGTDLDVSGTVTNAGTITMAGPGVFQSGGRYQHAQNGGMIPTATWDANSTCEVTGVAGTAMTGLNQAFGNLKWNCPGQSAAQSLPNTGTMTIAGNLEINSTGSSQLQLNQTSLTIAGNFTQTGGTLRITTASTSRTINVGGSFSQSGGTLTMVDGSGPGIGSLNVAGNFLQTAGGTITETSTSSGIGAIYFTGTGTQTFTSGGAVSGTINFSVINGATVVMAGGSTVTVNSGATLAVTGTFDCGTGTAVSGAGTFALASGATLKVGSPAGITTVGNATGNIQTTAARTFNTGANYIYNGVAAQVTGNGLPATVNNLTVNNGAGVGLTAGPLVSGTLTLASGALSIGANTLTINGAIVLAGGSLTGGTSANIAFGGFGPATTLPAVTLNSLTVNCASGIALAPTVTVNGTLALTLGAVTSAGNLTLGNGATISRVTGSLDAAPSFGPSVNVTYTGTAGVTTGPEIPAVPANAAVLNNLTLGYSSTVTATLGAAATVNGSLSINANNTLADGGFTLTAKSTVANSGTHSSGSGGEILLAGTTAQNVAGTFGNVEMNNAAGTALSGAATISGSLTVDGGTTFTVAGFNFTVGGTTSVGGTLTHSSATGAKTFVGNVIINNGGIWDDTAAVIPISFGGNLQNNGTLNAGTGIHTFTGASKTFGGANAMVIPNATVTGTYANNGTITATASLAGTGGLTQGTGATLNLGGTLGITSLTATASPNTVNYNGVGAQTVRVIAYNNLTLSGSGAKTLTSVATIGGSLTLSGSATMTGNAAFTVAGALNYGSSGSSTLTAATAISIGSFNQTAGTLADNGNAITVTGTGANTWFAPGGTFATTGTVTFTGAAPQIGVAGFRNLTLNVGAGNTATLTGAITVAGTLTITSGTLADGGFTLTANGGVANSGTHSGAGKISLNGGAAAHALSGSGTFANLGLDDSYGATLTGSLTVSGVMSGTGPLTKITAGTTATLSGNNTFSGVLTVQAGTLSIPAINNNNVAGPLGNGANDVVLGGAASVGTLRYTGTDSAPSSDKHFAIGATGDTSACGGVIQVDNSGTTLTLSGEVYQVNLGLLTKTGSGTLVLSGTADNSGLGAVVSTGGGTVVLAKASNGGVHAIGSTGFTLGGGTIQLGGTGGDQICDLSTETVNGGTFDFNGRSEAFTVLNGTGGTILNNGGGASTLTIGVSGNSSGGGSYSGVIADHASGSGTLALVKTGSGTQTLGGANTYTGGTTVGEGTLTLDYTTVASKLADTGVLTLGGGTLNLANGASAHTEVVGSTTINPGASSVTRASGTSVLRQNAITRNVGGTVNYGAASIADADGAITVNSVVPWATVAGANWATKTTSADAAITAYSSYTTTLPASGNNSTVNYSITGSATVTGNLQVNSLKLTTSASSQSLALSSGVTLTLSGNGLLFVGGNNYNLSGGNLTAGNGAGAWEAIIQQYGTGILTNGAAIQDNGANAVTLTKSGAGTLVLTGPANSFSGGTFLNAGTLEVQEDGGLGSGNVTVASGATLQLDSGATHNYINDSATVFLLGSGKVNLVAAADNDTVAALIIDGARQPAGTWGATGSGATHLDDTHFAGSGTLAVSPGALSAFRITLGGSPTAGSACALTITAVDQYSNTVTSLTGDHSFTFGGLATADDGTPPTVTDKNGAAVNLGAATTISFANGVSSAGGSVTAYKAETATLTGSDATSGKTTGGLGGTGACLTIANVNPVPGADTETRQSGMSLKIPISKLKGLAADPNRDNISFTSVDTPSAGGAALSANSTYVFYTPNGAGNGDTFTYHLSDSHGGAATGTVTVNVVAQDCVAQLINYSDGGVTVQFAGIPGYQYQVERSCDASFTSPAVVLTTNAPAAGLFIYTECPPLPPSAYYRLKH